LLALPCTSLLAQPGDCAEEDARVVIAFQVNSPMNLPAKPGFTLIFQDEFDSPIIEPWWNKSRPGDDGWGYGTPEVCEDRNSEQAPKNPPNVIKSNSSSGDLDEGEAWIRTKVGEDFQACTHSSGEMKTFSFLDPSYHAWEIYPGSYVEVRIKSPKCTGLAYSGWLWGENEIDFFESFGLNKADAYRVGLIWDDAPGHKNKDKSNCRDVKVQGGLGADDYLLHGDEYFTFGVELAPDSIKFFVNNKRAFSVKLYQDGCGYYQPKKKYSQGYFLRITSGSATIGHSRFYSNDVTKCGDENLPKYAQVDYVRVYQKNGNKVLKLKYSTETEIFLCQQDFFNEYQFNVSYHPTATYTWINPYPLIDAQVAPQALPTNGTLRSLIRALPGAVPGLYNLTLRVAFPSGYTEDLPVKVNILPNQIPPTPEPIEVILDDFNQEVRFAVPKQHGTSAYEWSYDGEVTWHRVSNLSGIGIYNICHRSFARRLQNYTVPICVRSVGCGTSFHRCENILIPKMELDWDDPLKGPGKPTDVVALVSSADSITYTLSTSRQPHTDAYFWSRDGQEWFPPTTVDSERNYFGEFLIGSDSFPIYTKSQNADFESPVHETWIKLPEGEGTCGRYSGDRLTNNRHVATLKIS
jgi:hypothetical protein